MQTGTGTTTQTLTKSLTFHSMYDGQFDGSTSGLFIGSGMKALHSSKIDDADIIVFNGGADIGTKIYNESPVYNGIPFEPSHRDKMEMEVFAKYQGTDKLLVGICRGSQLLNCLNGGTLWQDVNNHNRDHLMTVVATGEKIPITSTHHQMMRPNYNTAKIIAVANEATRKSADGTKFPEFVHPDDNRDTEIVWYGNTHSLCIQGHPEYVPGSHFAEYCLELIGNCLREIRHVDA